MKRFTLFGHRIGLCIILVMFVCAQTHADLVAYWPLNSTSGTTALDAKASFNGTVVNATWTTGRFNGGMDFDGTDDYVTIPNNAAFQITNAMTIAAWIRGDSWGSGSDVDIILRKGEDNPNNWQLAIVDGKVSLQLDTNDGSGALGSTTLSTGTWHHVAGTWDGSTIRLYLNGVQNGSSVAKAAPIGTDTRTVYIGGRAGTDCLDGRLDEVRLYNHALSAADIAALAAQTVRFTDVSSAKGFNVQTTSAETYNSGMNWADLDEDGDLDVIITGDTAKILRSTNAGASSFFVSNFFTSVRRQGALLDVDNDGDIDFFTGNDNSYDVESFFLNDGTGAFSDAGDYGFSNATNNEGVAAADIDGNGFCDVVAFSENNNWIALHNGASPPTYTGSNAAGDGLNTAGDFGNGDFCSSSDVNGDGFLDFFYHYNNGKLFLSDGDGTYTRNNNGISVVTGGSDKFGSAWGDYDNDGDLDLYCARYASGSTGYLWRNDSGTFTNVTSSAGITNAKGQRGACWGDVDNDGDLDLYICTRSGDNALYINKGDGTFLLSYSCLGATAAGDTHDAVLVDFDNDGDLDLAAARQGTTNMLYQNSLNGTSYLKVRAVGAGAGGTNKAAIGVRVDLYDAAGTTFLQRRDIGVARGFGGTQPLWVHFGGVTAGTTYTVRVYFKSGVVSQSVTPASASTTIGSTTINQMVTITEPDPVTALQVIRWIETDPHN